MRHRGLVLSVGLLLGVALHVDWHLARPHHHRWSLAWPYHWAATAALFAITGGYLARRWPRERSGIGALSVAVAVVVAQGIEPVLEAVVYRHRLGYAVEPARWATLGQTLALALPAFAAALWLCGPRVRHAPAT